MNNCKNCGEPVTGNYCSNCGQKSTVFRYAFKSIFKEAYSSIFELDSDFMRTVRALLTRPGVFVQNYLLGARKDYISPFKFLFIVIALNFAATWITNEPMFAPVKVTNTGNQIETNQWVTLLTHATIIVFMLPMAFGIRLFNKRAGFTFIEYYVFMLYIFTQSTFIYIIGMLLAHIIGIDAEDKIKGIIWLITFTVFYAWGYLNFFREYKTTAVLKFAAAYITGIGVWLIPLLAAGYILKNFINN